MNQHTIVRTAGGIVLIAIVAFLIWQESIDATTGVALIIGTATSIGLYERGKRQPKP